MKTAPLGELYPQHDGWPLSDLMYRLGGVRGALVYAALFVPELIEIDGCVFLRDLGINPAGNNLEKYSQMIREARSTSTEAMQNFLRGCNWIEVVYLFSDVECSDEEELALADLIVKSWSARLIYCFPGRAFHVRIISPDESGSVLAVGFEEASS